MDTTNTDSISIGKKCLRELEQAEAVFKPLNAR